MQPTTTQQHNSRHEWNYSRYRSPTRSFTLLLRCSNNNNNNWQLATSGCVQKPVERVRQAGRRAKRFNENKCKTTWGAARGRGLQVGEGEGGKYKKTASHQWATFRFLLWAAPFRVLFNNRTDSKKLTRLFSSDCEYAKSVCQFVCPCVCVDINYLQIHTRIHTETG